MSQFGDPLSPLSTSQMTIGVLHLEKGRCITGDNLTNPLLRLEQGRFHDSLSNNSRHLSMRDVTIRCRIPKTTKLIRSSDWSREDVAIRLSVNSLFNTKNNLNDSLVRLEQGKCRNSPPRRTWPTAPSSQASTLSKVLFIHSHLAKGVVHPPSPCQTYSSFTL